MPNNDQVITEAHESRIQRLEGTVQDLVATTTETGTKVDHLGEKVDETIQALKDTAVEMKATVEASTKATRDTLAESFKGVNDRLDKGQARFDDQDKRLDEHEKKFEQQAQLEKDRAARVATVKKIALPLLTGAAGVVASKFGNALWEWILRLFN